jgi:hypothetical protein
MVRHLPDYCQMDYCARPRLAVRLAHGLIRTCKVGRERICSIEPDALYAAERWLRSVMWARYGTRLGSVPEDYPPLRASVRVR